MLYNITNNNKTILKNNENHQSTSSSPFARLSVRIHMNPSLSTAIYNILLLCPVRCCVAATARISNSAGPIAYNYRARIVL